MEQLELLGMALGLAALSGINLYLAVFATSLALNMGWLTLSEPYNSLQVLDHPLILGVSLVLYLAEFGVDKVPWLDSLWDAVHTAIRPLGGALLGLTALGEIHPTLQVLAALCCGGVSLTTHSAKAGLRLLVNTSPEPVSNSVVSVGEDLAVASLLVLVFQYPLLALTLVIVFLALFIWLAPRLLRHILQTLRFIFFKLTSPGSETPAPKKPSTHLPLKVRQALTPGQPTSEAIAWALPVIIGQVPKCQRNGQAWLVCMDGTRRLGLIVGQKPMIWLETQTLEVSWRQRMLFDELTLFDRQSRKGLVLRLYPQQRGELAYVIEDLTKPDVKPVRETNSR